MDCDGRDVSAGDGGIHAGIVQHENDHLTGFCFSTAGGLPVYGFNDEIAEAEKRIMDGPEENLRFPAARGLKKLLGRPSTS
jgi:hypothetical protein